MSPDEYRRMTADVRRGIEREVDTAVHLLRTRCGHCWTPLNRKGYVAPGGMAVTLTTCPTCDRYRKEDDR